MDKAHGTMLKDSPHKIMLGPLVDFDDKNPTKILLRQGEARGCLLLHSTMNTQGRSHRGHDEYVDID